MGESFITPGAGFFVDLANLSIDPNRPLPSANGNADYLSFSDTTNLNLVVDPDGSSACGGGADPSSIAGGACANKFAYINIINDLNCASIKIKKITIKSTTLVLPQLPIWYKGLSSTSQGLVKNKAELTLDDQKKGLSQDLVQSIAAPCTLHYYKGGGKKEFSSTVAVCSSTLDQGEQYSICKGNSIIDDAMKAKTQDMSEELSSELNKQRDSDLKEIQKKCKVTATAVNITVTP